MGVLARCARLVPELVCADIGRSLDSYVGVLGFAVVYAREEERLAYLDREGAQLMLEKRSVERRWSDWRVRGAGAMPPTKRRD